MSLLGTDVCIKGDIVVLFQPNGVNHRGGGSQNKCLQWMLKQRIRRRVQLLACCNKLELLLQYQTV